MRYRIGELTTTRPEKTKSDWNATSDPTPNATSLSLEEPSQSEGSRISNQLDRPTGLTSEEGVAATGGVTCVEEEAMEVDMEP